MSIAWKFIYLHIGFVDEDLSPVKVELRAYGKQIEYLRSLPLHKSQCETSSRYGEFSVFEYKLCLTPELSTQILAMGENVEVLEPQELREEMKRRLKKHTFGKFSYTRTRTEKFLFYCPTTIISFNTMCMKELESDRYGNR